jgi:hypothetical protein
MDAGHGALFSQGHRSALFEECSGGDKYLTKDKAKVRHGKVVFAERCARCHSSKIPMPAPGVDPGGCAGPEYLNCWNKYWDWTKSDEFKLKMREIVLRDDFLHGNLLSTELRIPVTLLETNACSPLATNAIEGNIWDNFSSRTYKDLPSVGAITVHHPFTGEPRQFKMPAGGRGYTRPASLVSLWSTAPFFLNNSLGKFDPSPSVEARMGSFEDAIQKLLWPERREKDPVLGDKVPGVIDRTTDTSYLRVPTGYLPDFLQSLVGFGQRIFPSLFGEGGLKSAQSRRELQSICFSNLDLLGEDLDAAGQKDQRKKVFDLLWKMQHDLHRLPRNATDEQARQQFANLVEPMLALSKCPDFVVNRGHYFGTSYFNEEPPLSDDDKWALIEFMKTF